MTRIASSFAIAALLSVGTAQAETKVFDLNIKDHHFQPEAVTIPAGEKVKLMVHNQDATPEEFESYELNREKIIPGNSKAVIFVGPLEPGEYPFFGEFNQATAQGRVIAE
ncbi:cupredoxin domain-containing protein [Guyparkeria hydrothermalis]|uniref:cupredoxin domain-containing protein n=1 Tax=Guyparkeria hydrothermalis TaxID=923 RepID=UPI002020D9AB|nr:cupredoxin domain-containing protein [Guyparkeria hydrothermalis]MCL7743582.1 cupredoxin domain-containing protein [Guyparkeria hydrothermalis]